MLQAVLLLSPDAEPAYGGAVLERLRSTVGWLTVIPTGAWRDHSGALREADVLFTGWAAPLIDAEFLRHVPKLSAIFYAGGSVRYFVTEAVWQRGIRITTAQSINAVPVAEYATSALLLGLKRFWHYAALTRTEQTFAKDRPMPGAFGSVVGLVSYGAIARLVRERLRAFELEVVVHDPFLGAEKARQEGVRLVGLEELFATADAVSVHTPHLRETAGMIKAHHFEALRPGAFFLNTARGEVIDEPAMIEVLRRRRDVTAVLDVTAPEPPSAGSPLYELPNVVITPHIAGSMGRECERMGLAMIEEFERFRDGRPLHWEIDAAHAELIA